MNVPETEIISAGFIGSDFTQELVDTTGGTGSGEGSGSGSGLEPLMGSVDTIISNVVALGSLADGSLADNLQDIQTALRNHAEEIQSCNDDHLRLQSENSSLQDQITLATLGSTIANNRLEDRTQMHRNTLQEFFALYKVINPNATGLPQDKIDTLGIFDVGFANLFSNTSSYVSDTSPYDWYKGYIDIQLPAGYAGEGVPHPNYADTMIIYPADSQDVPNIEAKTVAVLYQDTILPPLEWVNIHQSTTNNPSLAEQNQFRKATGKSAKKEERKAARQAARKSARKEERKAARKSAGKSGKKEERKAARKSGKKEERKAARKAARKSAKKEERKAARQAAKKEGKKQ